MMHEEILADIGFTKNEAKIYISLLKSGESSIGDISKNTCIHRRSVYDVIDRLVEKGLVFEIITRKENRYKPVDPLKLIEIIEERSQKLRDHIPNLEKLRTDGPKIEASYVYRGVEGYKNCLREVLAEGEDVYIIGGKGELFDPNIRHFAQSFLDLVQKNEISFNILYDYEIKKEAPHILECLRGEYRFLPQSYSTDSVIIIFGDYIVSFSGAGIQRINTESTYFVAAHSALSASYRTWFSFLWNHCYPRKK